MIRLLKIDFAKIKSYRTFWVLISINFFFLALVTMSGMEALKWLASKGAEFGDFDFDITKVPLYHFPDIWQNITYTSNFHLLLGIVIIISITNEFAFKTIRQNVIDGMNRAEFISSKVIFILGLSVFTTFFVFVIGLIMGSIYSPASEMKFIFKHIEFIPAFFLSTFNYLLLAMVIALVIKRAGLSIVILLIYPALEFILIVPLPSSLEYVIEYLPYSALKNLIDIPFPKYAFMEIRDAVDWKDVLINIVYIPILIGIGYQTIANRNLG